MYFDNIVVIRLVRMGLINYRNIPTSNSGGIPTSNSGGRRILLVVLLIMIQRYSHGHTTKYTNKAYRFECLGLIAF